MAILSTRKGTLCNIMDYSIANNTNDRNEQLCTENCVFAVDNQRMDLDENITNLNVICDCL